MTTMVVCKREFVMKKDIVPNLIALGMTEREAKLYAAMIEKPEWRAGELHRITGVPRNRTHQTLELMVSRQYCTKRSEGRFSFYRSVHPKILKERLQQRWEEEMEERIALSDSTMDSLSDVFEANTANDRSLDFIEIVKTPHRIHQRFTELLLSAEEEILGFNRSPYSYHNKNQSGEKFEEQVNANRDIHNKLARSRSITMYEEQYWPFYKKMRNGIEDENDHEESRVIDYLPIKMFVFDRKTTLISFSVIDSSDDVMSQLVVHDTAYAEANRAMFEYYWDKACTFKEWQAKLKQKK